MVLKRDRRAGAAVGKDEHSSQDLLLGTMRGLKRKKVRDKLFNDFTLVRGIHYDGMCETFGLTQGLQD